MFLKVLNLPSGAERAAEKLRRAGESPEKRPSGAEARVDFTATYGTTKVEPFQNDASTFVFSQPVKPGVHLAHLRHATQRVPRSCPFKTAQQSNAIAVFRMDEK
jgi:hypothetical protein